MTETPTASPTAHSLQILAEQEIQFLCDLAEHCGKMAADMRLSVGVHKKSDALDLVTDADIALSEHLVRALAEKFPEDFLVSEEEAEESIPENADRIWYIDPIDGTDNYVRGDGQYSVMIGLLLNGQPHFGCVHSPAQGATYFGGPCYGSFKRDTTGSVSAFVCESNGRVGDDHTLRVRLLMGSRDRRANPWLQDLTGVKIISEGSVGLKVAKIVSNEADVYVHLSGKLKYWDTVGPIAIALGAGLEAGTLKKDVLSYPPAELRHPQSVVIGRPGSLAWSRSVFTGNSVK